MKLNVQTKPSSIDSSPSRQVPAQKILTAAFFGKDTGKKSLVKESSQELCPSRDSSDNRSASLEMENLFNLAAPVPSRDTGRCFRVFTYASHAGRDDKFCRSTRSAILSGVNVHVLGWGLPWIGLQNKTKGLLDLLVLAEKEDPECVIVFLDAYDTLYSAAPGESFSNAVVRKYEEIVRATGKHVVYSGECNCWPRMPECHNRERFPGETPTRFLNSGGWVATASAALKLHTHLFNEYRAIAGHDMKRRVDDQNLTAVAYAYRRDEFSMTLDHFRSIFATFQKVVNSAPFPDCDPAKDFVFRDGGWYDTRQNTFPNFLHFNGGSKAHMQKYEAKLMQGSTVDAKYTCLYFNTEQRQLGEVCDAAEFWEPS